MKYIAHRGNVNGINESLENSLEYIDRAIGMGYDVEIDLRMKDGTLFLGHDDPQYPVSLGWLFERKNSLWIHAKDFEALAFLSNTNLRYFYHSNEPYTLTSNGYIWSHDFKNKMNNMCIVPLLSKEEVEEYDQTDFFAVCSDFIFDCVDKFDTKKNTKKKIVENKDQQNKRIKLFICTYNDDEVLFKNLDSVVKSDLMSHDYEVHILNNYKRLELPEKYYDFNIEVINNEARPDFSRGHLSRSWNQGIVNGFKSVKNPDADYVILSQNDVEVTENWIENLLRYHEKYDFILFGDGDALQSMNIESVKKVGLYDERFCGIAYHESDYQFRQMLLNREKSSINDFGRNILHNQLYPNKENVRCEDKSADEYVFYKGLNDVIKWTKSGAQRDTEHHSSSYKYHGISSELIRSKWYSDNNEFLDLINREKMHPDKAYKRTENIFYSQKGNSKGWSPSSFEDISGDPDGKLADLLTSGKVKCLNPQPILYPYFELEIEKIYNKCYKKYPTMVYEDMQQLSDEKIGVIWRYMSEKKDIAFYPLDISFSNEEINYINKEKKFSNMNLESFLDDDHFMEVLKNKVNPESLKGNGDILIKGKCSLSLLEKLSSTFRKVTVSITSENCSLIKESSSLSNVVFILNKKFPLVETPKGVSYDVVYVTEDFLMRIPTVKMRNFFFLDAKRVLKFGGTLIGSYGHGKIKSDYQVRDFIDDNLEDGIFELNDPVLMINEMIYSGFLANTMISSVSTTKDSSHFTNYMIFTGKKIWRDMLEEETVIHESKLGKKIRTVKDTIVEVYKRVYQS